MPRMAMAERRAVLVGAAMAVIARDGFAAATIRGITSEAGMSLASFHYVFESRDSLLAEIIEMSLEREVLEQAAVAVPGISLEERVRSGFRASYELARRDPGSTLALFELQHHALRTPGLEGLARRQYERYWETAERFVIDAGFEWDRDTREVAQMLVAANDGIGIAWLATRDDASAERMIAAATAMICGMAL